MIAPRKLMITGGRGFVAGSVIAQAAGVGWEVHAISRGGGLAGGGDAQWHSFDPGDAGALARWFAQVRPDAVIHAAAMADIDRCEAQPAEARAVNVELTAALAGWCARFGARLVLCSTDTIFDGERAPYREADPPGPLNEYARTKVEAERRVMDAGANSVIARLSLVIGLPVLGAGNSFMARLISSLREGRNVAVPEREIRTPVDVITVARALLELAGGTTTGIVHLAGNDRLNRLELSRRIAARLHLPTQGVVPADPASMAGRAPRPRDVSLDNARARSVLATPMLGLEEGLSLVLGSAQTPPP